MANVANMTSTSVNTSTHREWYGWLVNAVSRISNATVVYAWHVVVDHINDVVDISVISIKPWQERRRESA